MLKLPLVNPPFAKRESFEREVLPFCLGVRNDALGCWLASQYHSIKNNMAPSVQQKSLVWEEPFLKNIKRKTHDIQAALLHSHRHVFSTEKRKKEGKRIGMSCFRLIHISFVDASNYSMCCRN